MAPKKTDFYERLGVAKDADETAIKKAYRTLALKHHPDKGGDPETFKLYAEVRATCFKPEDAMWLLHASNAVVALGRRTLCCRTWRNVACTTPLATPSSPTPTLRRSCLRAFSRNSSKR